MDFLVLSETDITRRHVQRCQESHRATILCSITNASVFHTNGSGRTIIHKDPISVMLHQFACSLTSTAFEIQAARVASSRPPVTIELINIYRPLSTSISDLIFELLAFLASLMSSVINRQLLFADLNYPGNDGKNVNPTHFAALHMQTHHEAARSAAHVLGQPTGRYCSIGVDVQSNDPGSIFNHRLVVAQVIL